MKNIAVFISGGGSNLQALIDAEREGRYDGAGKITLVVSSNAEAYGLERARAAGIKTAVFCKKDFKSPEEKDSAVLNALTEARIDCIVLAGYLGMLTAVLTDAYKNRIINIHPSLIPSFCGKGFYGLKIHEAVVDYGMKVTGVTVHFVDGEYDTGAIIYQEAVPVLVDDTAESLQQRVLEAEHRALPQITELLIKDRLIIKGRKVYTK